MAEAAPDAAGPAAFQQGLTAPQAAYLYVRAFVEGLAESGVRHACFTPGSRSTPLVIGLAEHGAIRLWAHIDERSAAYFALGMARALREPVAVVCTSGTAAANFYPAVIEARYGRVPLVVLTGDRPHELRDVGAPQAIDQLRLFGPHVKWFADMALPEGSAAMLRYARASACRAVAMARAAPPGPVHLNFPFREPLVPQVAQPPPDPRVPASSGPTGRGAGQGPYTAGTVGPRSLPPDAVRRLADELSAAEQGLIVCGPQDDPQLPDAAAMLGAALGFPILADPLSQVRCGPHDRRFVIDAYDALLREPAVVEALRPQVVLRVGAVPTSKPLMAYLERHAGARHIVVDDAPEWRDPGLLATEMVYARPAELLRQLAEALAATSAGEVRPSGVAPTAGPGPIRGPDRAVAPERAPGGRAVTPDLAAGGRAVGPGWEAGGWAEQWQALNRIAREVIGRELERIEEEASRPAAGWGSSEAQAGRAWLFEGRIFSELAGLLPDGATLFVGNSMPVRDLDGFFGAGGWAIRILANRGANGIDGVVSAALGVAAAGPGPVVAVIGDLSFYHDLNGLLGARLHRLSATLVLVHNDGGGIFSFLPQADDPRHFEALFGIPTHLDFQPAVEMYGGRFVRARTWHAFREAVKSGIQEGGLVVVEVASDRSLNARLHRRVWEAVASAVRTHLGAAGGAAGTA